MPALVTGATGHLGANLVRALEREGRAVRALVRTGSDPRGLAGTRAEQVTGDVLDPASLRRAAQGCDVVFHLAARYTTLDREADLIRRTAVEGTRNLYGALEGTSVRKVVYVSSVAAVGQGRSPAELRDETQWNEHPIDAYAAAKRDAERAAWEAAERARIPTVVACPGFVLGPLDFKPTPSNRFLLFYLQRGAPLWWDGGHSVVDVEDVAQGLLRLEAKGRPRERYILGGTNLTNQELYATAAALTGLPGPGMKAGAGTLRLAGTTLSIAARARGKDPVATGAKLASLVDYYGFVRSDKAREEVGYTFRSHGEVLDRAIKWFIRAGMVPEARLRRMTAPGLLEEARAGS